MSKPTNGAARNQMTSFERQCYDWGWEDAEQRIIKLLEETITNWRKCDLHQQADLFDHAIELIKGETNKPRAMHLIDLKDIPSDGILIQATTENSSTWFEGETK